MCEEYGFGKHRPYSTRPHQTDESSDQVDEKDEDIALAALS
jgi:hypothetical protein